MKKHTPNSDPELQLRLSRLPSRPAPPALIAKLKAQHTAAPWWHAWMWKPIGALTLATAFFAVWMFTRVESDTNAIDLEPLLASHARYRAESLIPPADMVSSDLSAHLVSYHPDDHD